MDYANHSNIFFAQNIEYHVKLMKNNQKVIVQIRFSKSVDYRRTTEGDVSQVCFYKCKTFLLVSEMISFQYNIKWFYLTPSDYMGDVWDAKEIKHKSLAKILITAVNQNQNEL